MFPPAKIVVIDNDEVDLAQLVSTLKRLGIASVSYQYPDEEPPEQGLKGVRLFITDINLIGGAPPGNPAQVLAPVISLLERIISAENGPYALITWSSTDLHTQLLERIGSAPGLNGKQPFFSMPLQKSDYVGDHAQLDAAIARVFRENAPFGALLDWEARVSRAGAHVLKSVLEISKKLAGETAPQRMDRALSKLAADAFGTEHVEAHRFEAVNEALLPLLGDALNQEFYSNSQDEIWNSAVTKHTENIEIDAALLPALNTAFLIECHDGFKRYRRGVILSLPSAWLQGDAFEERFGVSAAELAKKAFKPKDGATLHWVLVQAQAACDFANPKFGPIPYCLGAFILDNECANTSAPQYVWKSPAVVASVGGANGTFRLFICHSILVPMTRKNLEGNEIQVVGRIKDQVLNKVIFDQHSQAARPGIIEFRSKS